MTLSVRIDPVALACRESLQTGRAKAAELHREGRPGVQVCARLSELLDEVILRIFHVAAPEDDADSVAPGEVLPEGPLALLAVGGYGRQEMAPYSDVDLLLLYKPGHQAEASAVARRLTTLGSDAGLHLGLATRTPAETVTMALADATVLTSLLEARVLAGNGRFGTDFLNQLLRKIQRRGRACLKMAEAARQEERQKYGEVVYLIQPNVKRSRGGLRDLQLVRWVGRIGWGLTDFDSLYRAGVISLRDRNDLRDAREFLLRLRNELHFQAKKADDVLHRAEQIRIAEAWGYRDAGGVLAVEAFMKRYFQETGAVRDTGAHFVATSRERFEPFRKIGGYFTVRVDRHFQKGPWLIGATRTGLQEVRTSLAAVLRLMKLANEHNRRIDHRTWQTIRARMSQTERPLPVDDAARTLFLELMGQGGQLARLLRRLHELGVLERFVPPMAHARCLTQFNEYHKYTVDEHSLRTVGAVVELGDDEGLLGQAYHKVGDKAILHLAALVHDLGKGFEEDHSIKGEELARDVATHLRLTDEQGKTLAFLVRQHLLMSNLAQRRNLDDPAVIVEFARTVGSPDRLMKLFLLTAADMASVGSNIFNAWRRSLLETLYERSMQQLSVQTYETVNDDVLADRRQAVLDAASTQGWQSTDAERAWWKANVAELPQSLLLRDGPERIAADLQRATEVPSQSAVCWARRYPSERAIEFIIATTDDVTPGIFAKLAGALATQGMNILSAEINTLADSLILDRFYVQDLDYEETPDERLAAIEDKLVTVLTTPQTKPPTFRRVWRSTLGGAAVPPVSPNVEVDNDTSERYTILDIFATDRSGLLYTIAQALVDLGLSIRMAKIGTHLDQAVDVFYVFDQATGAKVTDAARLARIRDTLIGTLREFDPAFATAGPATPSASPAVTPSGASASSS